MTQDVTHHVLLGFSGTLLWLPLCVRQRYVVVEPHSVVSLFALFIVDYLSHVQVKVTA